MLIEDKYTQEASVERLSSSAEPSDSSAPKTASKKRKRAGERNNVATNPLAKKKKKKGTAEGYEHEEIDTEAGVNISFSQMDGQLLADRMAQRTRKYESDLSLVELEDKFIPGKANAIRDTTSWRKLRSLDNLPLYLEHFCENPRKLWSASKKNGAPHTIIVTAAGLRAADLARAVRKFQSKEATVAKLFAKHIKLQDSIKFLKSNRVGIAIGTPTRLKDLMDEGSLGVDRLERVVIDASHVDQKKRGILDMKETQVPLTVWLGQKELKERYTALKDGIQLMFY